VENNRNPNKMKICFICNEYPPMYAGGIGIFVKNLAEALACKGNNVHVLGYGRKQTQPELINGVKVHYIWLPHPLYKKIKISGHQYSIAYLLRRHYLSFKINRLLKQQRFDLVESYDFSGPLARKPKCKFIVRLHGATLVYRFGEGRPDNINPLQRHFEISNVKMADHVIAVSQHIGKLTNQVMGLDKPYQVIYNSVDTDLFSPQNIKPDHKCILFIGNMMWRKGVFDLIRAMPFILQKHPDAHLKIAGGSSGIHKVQLNKTLLEVEESVSDHIHLLGRVPHKELPALYNRSSVFVFPSRVEAFGLTCAEAMACGRPVVATSMASGPELIEEGISGLIADPTTPEDLAAKICVVLEDPALGQRLGRAARERALALFDLEKNLNLNLDFYHKVLMSH